MAEKVIFTDVEEGVLVDAIGVDFRISSLSEDKRRAAKNLEQDGFLDSYVSMGPVSSGGVVAGSCCFLTREGRFYAEELNR